MQEQETLGECSISVVVPCYNEEETLQAFYTEVGKILDKIRLNIDAGLTHEFIFIDDGSRDKTAAKVASLHAQDPNVRLIKFSRNFGKEAAILAGLKAARGKCTVLMDADLQDPPYLVEQMYQIYRQGKAKIIYAKRSDRKGESFLKAQLSEMFYKISNFLSDVKIESGVRDFRLMDAAVVRELVKMGEYHRFSKMMFAWVGFERARLEYDYQPRMAGTSGWNFAKLFNYAIEGLVSFSTRPIKLAFWVGLAISFASGLYGAFIVLSTLIWGNDVKGYASMVTIVLFLGGVQLVFLGVAGQYIARIYEEVKRRPHFIVEEEIDTNTLQNPQEKDTK